MTDELQFGFKPNIGCTNAIFTLRTTIDYFCEREPPSIRKASDTVNHHKMFDSLLKAGFPAVCMFIVFTHELV